MASIVATIRETSHHDNLAIMERSKKVAESLNSNGNDLPSYEDLFPNPLSALPNPTVTPSLYGNTSEVSDSSIPESGASKIGQIDDGSKYQPSLWYYEPGNNPVTYVMGQKVTNPFTEPLRALQSDGDRKKLKHVVTRNDSYRKFLNLDFFWVF